MASESSVRRLARRYDHVVYKSRERTEHVNNLGHYQLVNNTNTVVLGADFDATLEQIADYMHEVRKEQV